MAYRRGSSGGGCLAFGLVGLVVIGAIAGLGWWKRDLIAERMGLGTTTAASNRGGVGGELTAEQRQRWEQFRERAAGHYVVAHLSTKKRWVFSDIDGWNGEIPRGIKTESGSDAEARPPGDSRWDGKYWGRSLEETTQEAEGAAAKTNVDAVAVVTLSGTSGPTVVTRFFRDKDMVKRGNSFPGKGLDQSLAEFLRELQRKAGPAAK
jgi:hypothetical protein